MADDKDEAATPDESASAATPDEARSDDQQPDAPSPDAHTAPEGAREPTLEELEQMLEGDDPDDHDGADVDPADQPAELADGSADHGSHDTDEDPDGELVSVGAAPKSRSSAATAGGAESATSAVAKQEKKDRQKKDRATPKQKREVEKPRRTTPVGFVREAVGELRKVVYPTGAQLGNYFVVVLVFVLFIIAFVGLLDAGFTALVLKVLG